MMPALPRWASWMLACVLPPRDLEAVLGDLAEECALRSRSTGGVHVFRWYWSQIFRSIPSLLWATLTRGGWLATLAVAVAACVVQATVELAAKAAVSNLAGGDTRLITLFSWIVGPPSLLLVSYLAARIRPGAAIMLTAIVIVAVVVQLAAIGHTLPLWKRIAVVVVGPASALAGGVISHRKHVRSNAD